MAEQSRNPGGRPSTQPVSPVDPVERRIGAIEARLQKLNDAQRSGRWQMLGVVLAIIAMFAIFTYATVNRVKSNLSEDRLREAFMARMPEVRPQLEQHLQDVARDVLPVYREQAVTRFRAVGPEVAQLAIQRLKEVPAASSQKIGDQIRLSHDRVLARLEPELKAKYPSLTDDQKKQILATYFHDKIGAENDKIAAKMNDLHTTEAVRVQAALEKFGVGDATSTKPGERERQFLHALVDVMMDSDLFSTEDGAGKPASPSTTQPQLAAASLPADPAANAAAPATQPATR